MCQPHEILLLLFCIVVWLIWEWMVSGSKIGLLFFLQPPLPLPPFDSEKCEDLWDHYGFMVWHLARTSLVTSVCVFSLSAVRSVVKPKQMVEELQMCSQRVERGFLQKKKTQRDCKTRLASLITQTRISTQDVPTSTKPQETHIWCLQESLIWS